jgi:hypothetical protein
MTEFGSDAFSFCCSLKSIKILTCLLHIGTSCFSDATNLSQIMFKSRSQLASIGCTVFFWNCPNLHFFYISAHLQITNGGSFCTGGPIDPETQCFRRISCLINLIKHSVVHFSSHDPCALNSIRELGPHAFAWRKCLATVTFDSLSTVVRSLMSASH